MAPRQVPDAAIRRDEGVASPPAQASPGPQPSPHAIERETRECDAATRSRASFRRANVWWSNTGAVERQIASSGPRRALMA